MPNPRNSRATHFSGPVLASRGAWPDGVLRGVNIAAMAALNPETIEVAELTFLNFGWDAAVGATQSGPFVAGGINTNALFRVTSGGPGCGLEISTGAVPAHDGVGAIYSPRSLGVLAGGSVTFAVRFLRGDPATGAMAMGVTVGTDPTVLMSGASAPTVPGGVYIYTDPASAVLKLGASTDAGVHTTLATSNHSMDGNYITVVFRYVCTNTTLGEQTGYVDTYLRDVDNPPKRLLARVTVPANRGLYDPENIGMAPFFALTNTAASNNLSIRSLVMRMAGPGYV